MTKDPIARALDIVLARWNPHDLVGVTLKLAGARCPVRVTGYSPRGRNLRYCIPGNESVTGWMNTRQFVEKLP
jgi:hypothetical protein